MAGKSTAQALDKIRVGIIGEQADFCHSRCGDRRAVKTAKRNLQLDKLSAMADGQSKRQKGVLLQAREATRSCIISPSFRPYLGLRLSK